MIPYIQLLPASANEYQETPQFQSSFPAEDYLQSAQALSFGGQAGFEQQHQIADSPLIYQPMSELAAIQQATSPPFFGGEPCHEHDLDQDATALEEASWSIINEACIQDPTPPPIPVSFQDPTTSTELSERPGYQCQAAPTYNVSNSDYQESPSRTSACDTFPTSERTPNCSPSPEEDSTHQSDVEPVQQTDQHGQLMEMQATCQRLFQEVEFAMVSMDAVISPLQTIKEEEDVNTFVQIAINLKRGLTSSSSEDEASPRKMPTDEPPAEQLLVEARRLFLPKPVPPTISHATLTVGATQLTSL